MVIYNGVPLEKFRPSYLIANDSWPCDIKKIVVGGLGRLEYQKNWPCLIRAATKLPNNVIIKIAGVGREMKKIAAAYLLFGFRATSGISRLAGQRKISKSARHFCFAFLVVGPASCFIRGWSCGFTSHCLGYS